MDDLTEIEGLNSVRRQRDAALVEVERFRHQNAILDEANRTFEERNDVLTNLNQRASLAIFEMSSQLLDAQNEVERLTADSEYHRSEERRLRDVLWEWGLEYRPESDQRRAASAALFADGEPHVHIQRGH